MQQRLVASYDLGKQTMFEHGDERMECLSCQGTMKQATAPFIVIEQGII
jgi:hypothetical protein